MGGEIDNAALLEIIKKLLKTDATLDFLLRLQEDDLKLLVACIRARLEQV
ncbi:MAG: hypothetical protein BWX72_00354 [Firmicutes bacterium ADurb.Bin080]|jgi:hypothetical protein|nr:MAG: hypothetical protein BWX72_00354 [Firmicutes bacterium ADurb.Bin080]